MQPQKEKVEGCESVDYYAFLKGETETLHYTTTPATNTMLIKHLMSETCVPPPIPCPPPKVRVSDN